MKIKEQDLNDIIHFFSNQNIKVQILGDVIMYIKLHNVRINFNKNNGFLYIIDYLKNIIIKVNITTICSIELIKDTLNIQIDEFPMTINIKK